MMSAAGRASLTMPAPCPGGVEHEVVALRLLGGAVEAGHQDALQLHGQRIQAGRLPRLDYRTLVLPRRLAGV